MNDSTWALSVGFPGLEKWYEKGGADHSLRGDLPHVGDGGFFERHAVACGAVVLIIALWPTDFEARAGRSL